MQQIEDKYRDPESKNRLKQLKTDAQKQIERNKIILKDLINRYGPINSGRSFAIREDVPIPKGRTVKATSRAATSITVILMRSAETRRDLC
jgi:hypothetical protein